MAVKLLITGLPNTGKTTLLKDLDPERTLVISRDGKKFDFAIPHKTIREFQDVDDLINQIGQAINSYTEKYDRNPETIAIDSVSKILLDIEARVLAKVKSFPYGVVNTEITKLTEFLEHELAPHCNLIFLSHALYNVDTTNYELVNAGGSWGKKGGFLSEVNNGIFIEVKNKKRIIHHKSTQYPARSTLADIEDSQSIDDYNLQAHLDKLVEMSVEADAFEL